MKQRYCHQRQIPVFSVLFLSVVSLTECLISSQGFRLTPPVSVCTHWETRHPNRTNPRAKEGVREHCEDEGKKTHKTGLSNYFHSLCAVTTEQGYPWVQVEKEKCGVGGEAQITEREMVGNNPPRMSCQITVFAHRFVFTFCWMLSIQPPHASLCVPFSSSLNLPVRFPSLPPLP